MTEKIKRFTVVGRTKSSKYQAQERNIAVDPLGPNEVDHSATATIVPIDDSPSRQVKLLETDDEDEARQYMATYQGELVGLHIIDAQQNGRPGYRR